MVRIIILIGPKGEMRPITYIVDIANNRRSMDRNLDKSMYLIVKRNRESNSWQFPQGKLMDKEMLRSVSVEYDRQFCNIRGHSSPLGL